MRNVHRSPERDAYIAQNAETLDPELALAFTELPAAVSGISTVQRDALIERALEAQHGEALEEVQELERGIEIADAPFSWAAKRSSARQKRTRNTLISLPRPTRAGPALRGCERTATRSWWLISIAKLADSQRLRNWPPGHISPTLRNTARQWFAGRRQHEWSMNDRPVNANTIEQIDREAQELVSANQAFSKRKQAEGLRDGVAHKPIAGGDMNLKIVGADGDCDPYERAGDDRGHGRRLAWRWPRIA